MYYDNRVISQQDFYKRRKNLIIKLRTIDISQEKPFINTLPSYPYHYEKENQN